MENLTSTNRILAELPNLPENLRENFWDLFMAANCSPEAEGWDYLKRSEVFNHYQITNEMVELISSVLNEEQLTEQIENIFLRVDADELQETIAKIYEYALLSEYAETWPPKQRRDFFQLSRTLSQIIKEMEKASQLAESTS